jgi:hypothetical protein
MRRGWLVALTALIALACGAAVGWLAMPHDTEATAKVTTVRGRVRTVYRTHMVTSVKTVSTTVTTTITSPPPPPPPGDDDEDGDGCSDSYDAASCVPPYTGVDDVNCGDLGATDIEVLGDDPYGLDGYDNDGVACES